MLRWSTILLALTCLLPLRNSAQTTSVAFDFCGQQLSFYSEKKDLHYFLDSLNSGKIRDFYAEVLGNRYGAAITALQNYKKEKQPDDWLFYQLIRRMAQNVSPKEENYFKYTLFKWFFLTQTGYDAIISVSASKMLFYVQCDENIYNIPFRMKNGKQYICLNYHDYKSIDFTREHFDEVDLPAPPPQKTFSYRVTRIPDFRAAEYLEKDLHFTYNENDYHFRIKLTPQIEKLFINYPVVDYDAYLNIPLSQETYNSLIPQLKKSIRGMSTKNGVDFIMRFTRYAFLFETDTKHFGSEKRLSPEQTLFYSQSDCEDRVALFFYLVKEIYNIPMIVLAYENHVTVAVQFQKPVGTTIVYQGNRYSICEPTPQKEDLAVGQPIRALLHSNYQVAYAYTPQPNQ